MKGIDISNWQKGLKPSNLDIDFCICKATEGNNFVDKYCNGFIQDCIKNDILFGFYHFANNNTPKEEAEFFYNNCKGYFNKGIPILDYEVTNFNNVLWCEEFIKHVYELSGVWCMLYISVTRCKEYENSWIPKQCGLWLAGYPAKYTNWYEGALPYNTYPFNVVAIWQFTNCLKLDGYNGNLDGDIAYMDKNAWNKYANATKNETPKKTIDDLVLETLLGEYGDNETRKKLLGDNYKAVQKRINQLYKIANEVIDGKWGNDWNRKQALNGAGYPYDIVQKIVNDILN